ncbi:MAG: hypothetical protein FVQ82_09105 [Planctomycetes bacterium]|nr:hypothetical protein [Planctomycetota bacterium]
MNILSEVFILAAGNDFSWVVPVIFVAIWIIGGIGKVIVAAREDRKKRDQQTSVPGQPEKKMRYKPIPDASSPRQSQRTIPQQAPVQRVREPMPPAQRAKPEPKRPGTVATLKKAMHDAMEEAYKQQAKRQAPEPPPRRPKKVQRTTTRKVPTPTKQVAKEPVKQVKVIPQEGSVLKELLERENIRKAIIYSEILGKPLAMREQ